MAGLPDRAMSDVIGSKARLLELGSGPAQQPRPSIAIPVLCAGAAVCAILVLRKRLGGDTIKAMVSTVLRSAGATAAPMLFDHLGKEMAMRAAARNGRSV